MVMGRSLVRAALASPPRPMTSMRKRGMADDKTNEGTVSSAGESFNKKQKAEEAKYFRKEQEEQLKKLKEAKEKAEKEKASN